MAIIQWFCDEGGKYQKNAVVSLSGLTVSPHRLALFNDEWEALLRSYELTSVHMRVLADVYSAHGPKMPRDQTVDQRTEALLPFADCINRHLEVGIMEAWDVNGYASISTAARNCLGGSADPHYLCFVRTILETVTHLREKETVHIVFDDDLLKAWDGYLHYRAVCKTLPEIKKRCSAVTFARDDDYPALQAADMVAFLARLEANSRFFGTPNEWSRLFKYLITEPNPNVGLMRWYSLFLDEKGFLELAAKQSKPIDAP
jgi:uncharacterized protein DUF3800